VCLSVCIYIKNYHCHVKLRVSPKKSTTTKVISHPHLLHPTKEEDRETQSVDKELLLSSSEERNKSSDLSVGTQSENSNQRLILQPIVRFTVFRRRYTSLIFDSVYVLVTTLQWQDQYHPLKHPLPYSIFPLIVIQLLILV
jgi:hypothetical protein